MYQLFARFDRQKVTLGIIILLVAVTVLTIVHFITQGQYDAKLTVTSAPDVVKMSYGSVKDISVKSGQAIPIKSGTYTFHFWADGFDVYSQEITIQKGEDRKLLFELVAKSDEAKKELQKTKYRRVKDGIGSHIVTEGGKKIQENSPVLKHLPYEERDMGIRSCAPYRTALEKSHKIGICITVSGRDGEILVKRAYEKLAEFGVKPEEYDIRINNQIIPTEKEKQSKVAVPCGGNKPSWCYNFRDL